MICCCQVLHHSGCHGGSDVKVAKDMEGANEMGQIVIGEDDGRGFLHDDKEAGAYFEYG